MPDTQSATVDQRVFSNNTFPTILKQLIEERVEAERAKRKLQAQEQSAALAVAMAPHTPYNITVKQEDHDLNKLHDLPDRKPLPINFGNIRGSKRKALDRKLVDADVLVDQVVAPLKKAKLSPAADVPVKKERAEQASTTRYAPAHKAPRKKGKSASTNTETLMNTSNHPDWYEKVSPKANYSPGDVQQLAHTCTLIRNCIDAHNRGDQQSLEKAIAELTDKVHEIEFYPFLGKVEVKQSKVLARGGMYFIFGSESGFKDIFPYHLRADANILFKRWRAGDFEPSLLRGLDTIKSGKDGKTRVYHSGVKKEYTFKRRASVFGDNGLQNGQWFANRLCAIRDGAHAELEPGICGEKGKGAYSIVLANGGYADTDDGDIIHYCGTQSKNPTPTYRTQLLLDSLKFGKPIRVLRSKCKGKFAPKEGVRFDGLYIVVSNELLDNDTAMYRFKLERVEGQNPIRYEGIGARPTSQELLQLKKINVLLK